MTSKYKNKHRAPRKAKMGPLLDRTPVPVRGPTAYTFQRPNPELNDELPETDFLVRPGTPTRCALEQSVYRVS